MSFLPNRPFSLTPAKEFPSTLALGIALLLTIGLLTACGSDSAPTPQLPTRTPVPTFTPTPYVLQAGAVAQPAADAAPAAVPVEAAPLAPVEADPVEAAPVAEAAPAPVDAAPQPALAIVTSPIINVRTGPGTDYDLAGEAERGAELTILARDPAGEWFQVCCVNGQNVWVAAFLVETQGPVEGVAVAQNISAPPPTSTPAPIPPTNTPAPAQPTNTPAPSFAFTKFGDIAPRQNTNQVVSFFGALFNSAGNGPMGGGYKMMVEGPAGQSLTPFGAVFENGNPGLESEFIYNAKVEFMGATPGVYKAYVVDGGGNPVSEAFDFTVAGETRTFLPRWKQN